MNKFLKILVFLVIPAILSGCEGDEISRFDLATLVLSCVSVLVTVLGVGLGALALWGYSGLKSSARKVAKEVAEKVARDTAEAVAARTVAQFQPLETTAQEATELVQNLQDGAQDGTR